MFVGGKNPIWGNLHKNLVDLLQDTPCKCARMPAELAHSHPETANHLLHLDLQVKREQRGWRQIAETSVCQDGRGDH